jgi:hypothetical protein
MTLPEALAAMGYHELRPKVWLKPVGFQLFMFEEEKLLWTNWFRPLDDPKPAIWQTERVHLDVGHFGELLYQLKFIECYTRTDIGYQSGSQFELTLPCIE